ncbi:MAG TPA: MarR family transcriptional regulator [Baekduia sp.]|jgi:DNA-binding MarR family transcriptional regulator
MADPRPDLATTAWRSMRDMVHANDRRGAVAEALGMSFARAKALRLVADAPRTMRELAAGLATDPPYVTVMVDDLEQRGLVARAAHESDRRVKVVTATDAGRAAAAEAERMLDVPPPGLLTLSPEDLATLERILTAVRGEGAA